MLFRHPARPPRTLPRPQHPTTLATLRRAATALAVPALVLAAAPAHAYFNNYLTGTIIGTLNQQEGTSLSQFVRKTLNETKDGDTATWTYPASGKRLQVDGSIKPERTITDQGQSCRRLNSELKRGSSTEHWQGWFCKQKDGSWKSRHVKE